MKNMMVIEDNEADQFLIQLTLQYFDPNINIIEAHNGEQALAILKKLPIQPDCILLDINMPVMDGHEFLEQYSQFDAKQSPIAMLSSSDHEKDKMRSRAHECVKWYFHKPLELSYLDDMRM